MKRVRLFCVVLFCSVLLAAPGVAGAGQSLRVLFTHDLHSNMLPWTKLGSDDATAAVGGYARLTSAIRQEQTDNSVLVDAGDYSMGTFFNGIFETHAPDLGALALMGYDATTFGNHEFDYRPEGLARSLDAARLHERPAILASNLRYGAGADSAALKAAAAEYGVQDYTIIERDGIKVGLFGLLGAQAQSFTGTLGTLEFEDTVKAAQACTDALLADGADVVIALSHSGTVVGDAANPKSEDVILAKQVTGLEIVVSGHSHTVLTEPLMVGDVAVVSCGCYGQYLGVLDYDVAAKKVTGYELLPVDESLDDDVEVTAFVRDAKQQVQSEFLDPHDLTFDEVVITSEQDFTPLSTMSTQFGQYGLTNLITDGYLYEVNSQDDSELEPATIAVVGSGIIRGTLFKGAVTEADLYNISSLGLGADGTVGYPLVEFYLNGSELKALCEVDVSVFPIMPEAQLFFSGVRYELNQHRLIFNKVISVETQTSEGLWERVQPKKLYRVICSLYLGQMAGLITDTTKGILSITPRDASGAALTDINTAILHGADGAELKEWLALSDYTHSLSPEDFAQYYTAREQRISVKTTPVTLLKNPSGFALIAAAVVIVLLVLLVGVVLLIRRALRKRKARARRNPLRPQKLILPK
jgi:2',3'-cyclic-nucleotide 2'-phosphodiesterase (5'-nucleotidase family)